MNGKTRITRFTTLAATLAGLLALASMASYLFWPDALTASGADFFLGIQRHTALFRFTYLAFAFAALLTLALVLGMLDMLGERHRDLVRWITLLGTVGYAVVALHFFSYQTEAVRTAAAFAEQAGSYEGYGIYLNPTASGEMLVAPFPPSTAEEPGFERGDVLMALNGQAVPQGITFQELYERYHWDGPVTVSLRGVDGAQREVTLDSAPHSFWNMEAQQAILASGEPALDRNLTFGFGLAGLWLVVVNWLARRQEGIPGLLPYVGIGAGLALWAFTASNQFGIEALSLASLIGGLVLLPAWLVWTGFVLRRVT